MIGPLANPNHELFAQELAKGKLQHVAYLAAGYRGDKTGAARLAKNPKVQARVSELQAGAAKRAEIDAAWVLKNAAKLYEKAMEAKAFSAAKGALDLIGKHVEVQAFREQVQHSGRIEYSNLSDEELNARIAALTVGSDVPAPTTH
jgi:phage terminase small subunit